MTDLGAAGRRAEPKGRMVETGAPCRGLHPARLRRALARARQPQRAQARGDRTGRRLQRLRPRRFGLRHPGHRGHRRPSIRSRSEAHRAIRDHRDRDRAGRGLRPSGHRHRRRPFGLGTAVHRHHDRTTSAVARPPGPHSPVSPGGLGVDRRSGDPGCHDVGYRPRRHHGYRRRRAALGDGCRRFPRPRRPSCSWPVEPPFSSARRLHDAI